MIKKGKKIKFAKKYTNMIVDVDWSIRRRERAVVFSSVLQK